MQGYQLKNLEQPPDLFPMKPIRFYAPVVTQAQLAEIRALDVSIARLKRSRDQKAASVLESLMNGAQVEPGSHDAALEVVSVGARKTQKVVVV